MRPIKFRAWNIDKNIFEDPDCLYMDMEGKLVYQDYDSLGTYGMKPEKYKYVLQQFTGLKDKNGKEIYEGDIVQENGEDIGEVEYDDDSAMFYLSIYNGRPFHELCSIEIIGNVYENGDLIKSDEDNSFAGYINICGGCDNKKPTIYNVSMQKGQIIVTSGSSGGKNSI